MRYVAFSWGFTARDDEKRARRQLERLGEGWTTRYDRRGFLLAHHGDDGVATLPFGMGFVLGAYDGAPPDPSPPCEARFDPIPGWVERRWGAYVAFLIDSGFDIVRVLRDPSGALPCYLHQAGGFHTIFSDARDFVRMMGEAAPDLGFIHAFLRNPVYVGQRTGLKGVEELWPGECVTFSAGGRSFRQAWSPQRFARSTTNLTWDEGRRALREAGERVVASRTAGHARVALRLSGGFDSSLMLGLLKCASQADIVCVNEYWEGAPEGDEREIAASVAAARGADFRALRIDPYKVEYSRVLAAPLTVKPTLALLSYANPEIAEFYASLACGFIASGQGGDHLFHRSRTPWIAADALRDGMQPDAMLAVALDTARLTGRSVWAIFAAMAKGAIGQVPPLRHRSRVMDVLTPSLDEAPWDHAWLEDAQRASPSRMLRVQQLLDALMYFDASVLDQGAPARPLLLSQPIIEACLRIPPYVMTQGGKERALARAAFADLVPTSVLSRATKGETTRYFMAVLGANADWMRAILTNGRLVEEGVVDPVALESALKSDWRQDGLAADGLYALIAAECWLRNLDHARDLALQPSVA